MSLAILSDENVRMLLESLTSIEMDDFQYSLKHALHEYSTSTQAVGAGLIHQPERSQVHCAATNATTLFMPSCSTSGHGVKVVTLSGPSPDSNSDPGPCSDLPAIQPTGSVAIYTPQGTPVGFLHAKQLTAFRTALASSCLLSKRAHVRTLTVFGAGLQAYWHVRLALMLRGATVRRVNIINRSFSENARQILRKLHAVATDIKRREGWEEARFSILTPGYGEYDRLLADSILEADVLYCCTPSSHPLFDPAILTSHEGRRRGRLIVAVGSYTPDMRELPVELLEQATKRHGRTLHLHKHAMEGGVVVVDTLDGALKEAGEIIDAGLKPDRLVELGELVMIDTWARQHDDQSTDGLALLTDPERPDLGPVSPTESSRYGSVSSMGSNGYGLSATVSTSTTAPDTVASSSARSSVSHQPPPATSTTALSHILHPMRRRRASSSASAECHMSQWLTSGNVVYKSVGLGLMDLVVGMTVIKLARQKGVGIHINDFS